MELDRPSRTAQGTAMHRAAHQLVDHPPIFIDPLALKIVGEDAADKLRAGRSRHTTREGADLRAFIAMRSRFTEDCLAEAMARGVRQYVLLGAGLDTFAYRTNRAGLRIFEVDHPATQAWKRARLAEVGIAEPPCVTFAPVDFERETLRDGLTRAAFDFAAPAMFAWLGVTMYLTQAAVMGTLGFVASLAQGTEIVFDLTVPPDTATAAERSRFQAMADYAAKAGEPFLGLFESAAMARALTGLGFSLVEDFDLAKLNARFFEGRADGLQLRGLAHLMRARV